MSAPIPQQLQSAREDVDTGKEPVSTSVRELLRWFGSQKRAYYVNQTIREALESLNLMTDPDFDSVHIDTAVKIVDKRLATPAPTPVSQPSQLTFDPAHRIGRLASGNKPLEVVGPQDTVAHAVTVMLGNDYSQLPVMTSEIQLRGMISWKSIGARMVMKRELQQVKDCMDPAIEVKSTASIFAALPLIAEHDYVLIRDPQNKTSGIVTAADLTFQFRHRKRVSLVGG